MGCDVGGLSNERVAAWAGRSVGYLRSESFGVGLLRSGGFVVCLSCGVFELWC